MQFWIGLVGVLATAVGVIAQAANITAKATAGKARKRRIQTSIGLTQNRAKLSA
jgi:hypothetical protein